MSKQFNSDGVYVSWQPQIENVGEVLSEREGDIDQAIKIILATPLGSDPLRADFGSVLYSLIDTPINESYPLIVQQVVQALSKWEPRIAIDGIYPEMDPSGSAITLKIEWHPIDSVKKQTTEVKL